MANYTKLRKVTYQSEGNGITFTGILVTLIMGLLPFWQMREILIRTKSVRVVTPIVPKEENPYGEFLSTNSNLAAFLVLVYFQGDHL